MRPRRLAVMLALASLYVVAGKAGLYFAVVHASASPIWPPTGLALAALLVLGFDLAPAIFVGAFIVNVTTAGSVVTSLGIALGNTLEALVGAWLVRRLARGAAAFERAQDIFAFVALAGCVSTTVSATIGVTTLAAAGYATWDDFRSVWLTWWLGDVGGSLVVAPLLILWSRDPTLGAFRGRLRELTALVGGVVVTALIVFAGTPLPGLRNAPIAFLCLPVLVWVAFRFGPRETATVIAALAAVAVTGTLDGQGPFAVGSRNDSLLLLEGFMATVAVTMLPLAALVRERRRVEDERATLLVHERQARGEAEAANRTKDQFLAMLGHELRNPLGAISTAVHVLGRTDPASPEAGRALRVIGRQTAHLARLVGDLLDVARVMAGKIALEHQAIDLGELTRQATSALTGNERLARHAVSIETEPVWVLGDATRLEQIVMNLLDNAAKYTPAGGRIAVEVRRSGQMATLSVTDTGVGMPADLVPRVFDLFVQGDRSLDRSDGGLGVGLTLVKHLVGLHGGSVAAASAGQGRGSRFTVQLPVVPAPLASSALDSPAVATAGRRVLIVDDNDDFREAMRELLGLLGHEVEEASDGISGVDAALRWRPDVALVDLGLPGLDGFEVARRIRRDPFGRYLRLIAVTGYGRPEDHERALAAGFDSHVLKPVDIETIKMMIDN